MSLLNLHARQRARKGRVAARSGGDATAGDDAPASGIRVKKDELRLLDAVRSDNNPQGFIIEGFEVTENKDLQTLKR